MSEDEQRRLLDLVRRQRKRDVLAAVDAADARHEHESPEWWQAVWSHLRVDPASYAHAFWRPRGRTA